MTPKVLSILLMLLAASEVRAELPEFEELQNFIVDAIGTSPTPEMQVRNQLPNQRFFGTWMPPEYFRRIVLLKFRTRDTFYDTIHHRRYDITWPRYEVKEGVLHYDLGAIWAFSRRPRLPTDRAVQLEFVNQLHRRRVEADKWEQSFWNPVLAKVTRITEKLYRSAKEPPSAELFSEQDRLVALWRQTLIDAVTRHAKSQGITQFQQIERDERPQVTLMVRPNLQEEIKSVWKTDRVHVEIGDALDANLYHQLDGWPKVVYYPVPTEKIVARGSFFCRARVDPADVSPELVAAAKKQKQPLADMPNRYYLLWHMGEHLGLPLHFYHGKKFGPQRYLLPNTIGLAGKRYTEPGTIIVP